jgi:tetratricopeptide (TPR) repeat protein
VIGRTLGDYHLRERLGAGGMGTAYLAEAGDELVTVKVLHPHLLERAGYFKRFQREARVGQRVDHPHVVRTRDCDLALVDGQPVFYLVAEYVDGRTLSELGAEMGPMPEALLREVARQITEGLVAIHAAGIVHRDLKPQNVLITDAQEVKITDLGLAWLPDPEVHISSSGQFLGSLLYAAPEQIQRRDRPFDGRTDLYALGLLLHELAAGVHPYAGAEAFQVIDLQLGEAPPRLGEVSGRVSPFFEEVVAVLLEKAPEARFASSEKLLEVLERGERSSWWRSRTAPARGVRRTAARRLDIGRETAIHGRGEDLEALEALFEDVRRGRGRATLIEGEPGIGKTRLVDELVARLVDRGRDVVFLHGGFPPGGAATGLGAYLDAIRDHLGEPDLETGVADLLRETPLLVPAFTALLRGEPPPAGSEPLGRDALQLVLDRAIRTLAAERPVVLLVDDVHLAPEEGRGILAHLVRSLGPARVLLVANARPGLAGWWSELERFEHVSRRALERLEAGPLEDLLAEWLGSRTLAGELAGTIARKSDGNPFFALEILRELRDRGDLRSRPDGTWETRGTLTELPVPSAVLDLVRVRLEALEPDDRHLLEVAACCGYRFDPLLVAAALGRDRISVLRRLGEMERARHLVHASGREFVFDHHHVQEVLYRSLPALLREEIHAALADALAAGADATGETAAAICRHDLRAGRGEAARPHLKAALAHLERSAAPETAVEIAGQALAREGLLEGEERIGVLLTLAGLRHLRGEADDERSLLDEAATLADEAGDGELRARVRNRLGLLALSRGEIDEARTTLEEAVALAAQADAPGEEMAAVTGLGHIHADREEPEAAEGCYVRSRDLAREAGLEVGEGGAIGNLGFLALENGRLDEARRHFESCLDIFRRCGDRQRQGMALGALGLVLNKLGRYEEAIEHHREHLRTARAVGDRRGEAAATGSLGNCLADLGRVEEALEHLERDRDLARELGDPRGEAIAGLNLVFVFVDTARWREALDQAEASLELARSTNLPHAEAELLRQLGRVKEAQGLREAARRLHEEAVRIAEETGNPTIRGPTTLALGRFLLEEDPERGRELVEEAYEQVRDGRHRSTELLALAVLAGLDEAWHDEATRAFEELASRMRLRTRLESAWLLYRATGDRRMRDEARADLGILAKGAPAAWRAGLVASDPILAAIAES